MRVIAVEEAFSVAGLATPVVVGPGAPMRPDRVRDWERRLPDFTGTRLEVMDEYGIDVAVLSLTAPGVQVQPDPAVAVDDARRANDVLAAVVAANPTRFAGLAALPLQDPAAAVAELERAVRELGLRGALVNGPTLGHHLDEPRFRGVWEALEALDVPLYLHPTTASAGQWPALAGRPELDGPSFSWAAETGAHALRLVYAGVFDDFPGARLVLGHMGEFLPFQMARLDARHLDLVPERELARRPSEYVRDNTVITTSGVCSHAALLGAVLAVGVDNVMFAVDYPYESTAEAVDFLAGAPLGDQDVRKIAHLNAERVFRLSAGYDEQDR